MAQAVLQGLRLELMMTTPVTPATPGASAAAANPTLSQADRISEAAEVRTRIPMSVPRARLSTPDIPGFHCHWINDHPGRVAQAVQAGYVFVSKSEALVTVPDLAGSLVGEGTDLGDRVSLVVGRGEGGTPLRAYLMKIRQEWYHEDQRAHIAHVDAIHEALRQGKQKNSGDDPTDMDKRYISRARFKANNSRSDNG